MNASPLTTRRAMGIETEFGIVHADNAARERSGANASVRLSHYAVAAYALLEDSNKQRVRWDYGDETPLRDARGFELQRAAAHPTQLTHEVHDAHVPSVDLDQAVVVGDDVPQELDDAATIHFAERRAIGNAVLSNGARWYVDHAHPEYSSPEVMSATEGVVWDRAGEEIARRTMKRIAAADGIPPIALYKNNTDGKGQSYGCHENYLMSREIPFERIAQALIPFFATRQILVGSGRVGLGTRSEEPGFQISSRADFFETEVGLETTLNRPIVNSRDESHADASRFRRLHVIIGDSNLFETATFLKLGMTSLILGAIEREYFENITILPQIELTDPVAAVHAVSHDLSLRRPLETRHRGGMTALQIQQAYLEAISQYADHTDAETLQVLTLWKELLAALGSDPARAASHIEWVGKYQLLNAFATRHGIGWDDPRLLALDIQFSDLREESSLFSKIKKSGRVETLVSQAEVEAAIAEPPHSTRAYTRGTLVNHHRSSLDSAGWDTLTLRTGGAALRLRFADPELGSKQWCARMKIDPYADYNSLIESLRSLESAPAERTMP